MTDRNKGSFDRKKLRAGRVLSGASGKDGNLLLLSENCLRFPSIETASARAREQKFPRELMLIAALRGGGDPNETINQGRLHRCGARSLGDGCICDAPCSRKRHYYRRQRRRRAGKAWPWPWSRSHGPRRPRSSLWMEPRTRSSPWLVPRSSSPPSLIAPPESTFVISGAIGVAAGCCNSANGARTTGSCQ